MLCPASTVPPASQVNRVKNLHGGTLHTVGGVGQIWSELRAKFENRVRPTLVDTETTFRAMLVQPWSMSRLGASRGIARSFVCGGSYGYGVHVALGSETPLLMRP